MSRREPSFEEAMNALSVAESSVVLKSISELQAHVAQLREALSLSLRAVNSHQAFEFAETRAEQRLALQDREAIDAIEALGIPEAKGWDYEEAEQRIKSALAATDPKP